MNTSTDTSTHSLSGALSDDADLRPQDGRQTAAETMKALARRVEDIRAGAVDALSHKAAQAEDLAHRGLDQARKAATQARDRAADLRDQTAHRVQTDPMKALLIATAAGAATVLLVQWLSRSRHSD